MLYTLHTETESLRGHSLLSAALHVAAEHGRELAELELLRQPDGSVHVALDPALGSADEPHVVAQIVPES